MAERKAVNKYYPPDWDPRKGSVNKRVGQHPLRDRARKLSQGILVIRFELPYNIWCGGCGSHVGMGVRYNAEKSKVGNYYSTPIYKFRMKCHLCDNYFEIQTDPKNHDYVILSGARRKEQRWDPVANEQIVPEDKTIHKKMAMDAMYKLEHGSDDMQKGKEKKQNLAELESSRFSMRDDYILNRMARDKFRTEKRQLKAEADADQAILDRGALDIELLEETEEDRNLAGLLKYSVTSSFEDKQKEKRRSIEQRPLFEPSSSADTSAKPSSSQSVSSPDSNKSVMDTQQAKQKLGHALKTGSKDPFSLGNSIKLTNLLCHKPSSSPGSPSETFKLHKSGKSSILKPKSIVNGLKHLAKSFIVKKKKSFSYRNSSSKEISKESLSSGVLNESTSSKDILNFSPNCELSSNPQVTSVGIDETKTNSESAGRTDLESESGTNVSSTLVSPTIPSVNSPACDDSVSSSSTPQRSANPESLPSLNTSTPSSTASALASLMESYEEGNTSEDSDS